MAAEAAKPWLHELTAADLYAHCRIADERRALEVTIDYTAWLPYRVPRPREASNEDLAALKPLYVELLREPARKFDEVLDGPCAADDGRAVLLYALEYAMLARGARTEVGGLGAENFPLHVPCKRIATEGRLLRWCRDALRASRDRRAALILSCVGLLRHSAEFLKRPRAAIEDFLGAGGLEALWDDCASCLRRYDARAGRPDAFPASATAEIMLLCVALDGILVPTGPLEGIVPVRHREFFAGVLEHARPKLDGMTWETLAQFYAPTHALAPTRQGLLERVATVRRETAEVDARAAAMRRRVCDGPGCSEAAPSKCRRCGLAAYCSRECQKKHWKSGHKQVCRPTDGGAAAAAASAAKARAGPSPLLAKQDAMIREHGSDYVLDFDAEKYFKVEFENPMASVFFRTLRVKAKGGCRRSLYMMYDQLCGLSPELTQQVRRQLRGEYGVDPQACKDAPLTASISAADIQAATPENQRAALAEQLSRDAETDPEIRGDLAAAGHRLPPPRYSAATQAFARSRGVPDTEEGSAAYLFEIIMTERLERSVLLFRNQPHGDDAFDPYDVERWTSNCGGDADMARRVVAVARARVLRHDRENA